MGRKITFMDISSDKLAKSYTRRPGHGYEKETSREKLKTTP